MAEEDVLREIAPQVLAIQNAPVAPNRRSPIAKRIGRKAAGLALLPSQWTPPFIVIEAAIYERWRDATSPQTASYVIATVAEIAGQEARKWDARWDRGVTVRSSATEETLSERGSNDSVELAADYDGAMIARAILQVFERFLNDGSPGAMAIVVQARVAHLALGHMSNEQRVSKTINQWMWEYEPADKPGGRFNSQRDTPPDEALQLSPFGHRPSDFTKLFRKIGRWCTRLQAGRTHLEWGATANDLWLFQLDFEEDQPETGGDPTAFLRDGDFRPPGTLSVGSPFQIASLTGQAGWRKIDKVADFSADRSGYPTLIYITGDKFLKSVADGYDLSNDLEGFAHGRIVCRTDCRASGVSSLNLPRTHTVSSAEAVLFITKTIADFGELSVAAEDLCFILHKFIPSVTAAWAVARKDSQIVRVDSLWGLPDGLQYLPHDSYEYDVRRKQQSSERPRYKHAFLQETPTGQWEVIRVVRRATRWRSLPTPDLAEVASALHDSHSVDAVILIANMSDGDVLEREKAGLSALAARLQKPVLLYSHAPASPKSLELAQQIGLTVFATTRRVARTLGAMARFAHARREGVGIVSDAVPVNDADVAALAGGLVEYQAKALMARHGLPVGKEELVRTADDAVAVAGAMGGPVALKIQSAAIQHKTEVGGVALGLEGAEAVRSAFDGMLASVALKCPDAPIDGVLVQKMLMPGTEFAIGIVRDPDLGLMMMVGLGGVFIEVLEDVTVEPLPIRRDRAVAMLRRLKAWPILEGVRGKAPLDVDALAATMEQLSLIVEGSGDAVREIDLNPVFVYEKGKGMAIVDALVVGRDEPLGGGSH